MSTVHANLDDLRRLQRSVGNAQRDIETAIKTLQRQLNSTDWNDSARRDFESKLKEAVSAVRQTNTRIAELNPILNKKISVLSQFLGR